MVTLVWLIGVTQAQELSGFAELRGQLSGGLEGVPWQTVEVYRPSFDVEVTERVKLHATPQLSLVQGRYNTEEAYALIEDQLGPALEAGGCSLEAPPRLGSADDAFIVDRLYVDLYGERLDVRVGRQAVNWGSAQFLNPTDLFAEVLLSEPWRQRQGVDAARVTVPIGERHQVMGVVGLTKDLQGARAGVKATANALGTDVSVLIAALSTDVSEPEATETFVGFDIKGQAVVGFWAEGRTSLSNPALVVSTGVDYSFNVFDRLIVAAQYTYDGTGLEDPALYSLSARGGGSVLPDCAEDSLEDEGVTTSAIARFTIGQHYGLMSVSASAFEDWSASMAGLMNLEDRSTLLIPSVSWRPGAAWTMNLGAQVPLGDGEFAPGPALSTLAVGPAELDLSGLIADWTAFAYVRYSL